MSSRGSRMFSSGSHVLYLARGEESGRQPQGPAAGAGVPGRAAPLLARSTGPARERVSGARVPGEGDGRESGGARGRNCLFSAVIIPEEF